MNELLDAVNESACPLPWLPPSEKEAQDLHAAFAGLESDVLRTAAEREVDEPGRIGCLGCLVSRPSRRHGAGAVPPEHAQERFVFGVLVRTDCRKNLI